MSRRVLVTGSEGFVGKKLCAYLEAQDYDILGCDLVVPEDKKWRGCDFTDSKHVLDTIRWATPLDVVIHLAAITFIPEANDSPSKVMDVNLQGTIRLIEAMQAHAPAARLLFISSAEAYGLPQQIPIKEEHQFNPTNPYAISKAAADQFCRFVHEAGGLRIVRIRPFNHSGAGQSEQFVLSSFARQIAAMEAGRQEPILKVGNLDVERDFMHVDDVLQAYELAIDKAECGEAYNLCSGTAQRIRDAVDKLVAMASIEIRVETDPNRVRAGDIATISGSHEKFSRATGWRPERSFESILSDLLAYWRTNI